MLDEQAATPNPYAELLSDPDPQRAMGAMRIMMESGDPVLIDLAMEHGLLSSDSRVQRFVVERLLDTGPILSVTLDGTGFDERERRGIYRVAAEWGGTIDPDGIGYTRWKIGDYSHENECWVWSDNKRCAVVSRPEGFFIAGYGNGYNFDGKLIVMDDGRLAGILNMTHMGATPVSITLLD